ncbi:MAG: hypothetical protein HOH43_19095 [Candidatus Latescibacteria bacterium]|jgi:hypothetical protein|nr:hypothetical protein [Gemmatimonadota bacterium]MBT5875537.1 hypothetical protein [Candidatus Latescibacterota bacterium]
MKKGAVIWVFLLLPAGTLHAGPPPGSVLVEIHVVGAQGLYGWNVDLSLPDPPLTYLPGSFRASGIIPSLRSGILAAAGNVSVGGQATEAEAVDAQNNLLGTMRLTHSGPLELSFVIVTEFSLFIAGHGEHRRFMSTEVHFALESLDSDFDTNGIVDFTDFFLFANGFGSSDVGLDLDGDGFVDYSDFFIFAGQFGSRAEVIGQVILAFSELGNLEGVVVIGSIESDGGGIAEVTGSIAPEDTTSVDVVGSISE